MEPREADHYTTSSRLEAYPSRGARMILQRAITGRVGDTSGLEAGATQPA
jgi:hypothetical protein